MLQGMLLDPELEPLPLQHDFRCRVPVARAVPFVTRPLSREASQHPRLSRRRALGGEDEALQALADPARMFGRVHARHLRGISEHARNAVVDRVIEAAWRT